MDKMIWMMIKAMYVLIYWAAQYLATGWWRQGQSGHFEHSIIDPMENGIRACQNYISDVISSIHFPQAFSEMKDRPAKSDGIFWMHFYKFIRDRQGRSIEVSIEVSREKISSRSLKFGWFEFVFGRAFCLHSPFSSGSYSSQVSLECISELLGILCCFILFRKGSLLLT